MGFTDFLNDAGLTMLNNWLETRSYIVGFSPSQADVAVFKAQQSAPDAAKFPHAARWYKHINSWTEDFATLPGDASQEYTTYGPEKTEATLNPSKAPAAEEEDDDDEVDLFGSDDEEEDAEAAKLRDERVAEYKKKKEGKTKPAAKSVVTMDVKPWDDETDMKLLEASVRSIEKDGLVWGASKLVAVGFGIKKLQINLVIEDDKIGLDDLQEELATEFDEYIQSSDIRLPISRLLFWKEPHLVNERTIWNLEQPTTGNKTLHSPNMTWISKSVTGLGLLFLTHACYSAHEHSVLQSTGTANLSSITSHAANTASLPIDISIETIVSIFIVCLGLVLGTPELRPIQWRVWAGKIEREGAKGFMNADGEVDKDFVGNPFRVLESRPSFIDIRRQRYDFAEWVREGGEQTTARES
ncbi:putative Elongation factor 1-beta [Sclerotinia borealis F-4128]|uniref:Elongation factor 1-beta n=1 Tax=Sclerotinia borealis (strain F-4128) TaxID=1432307 RepID=W9C9U7_SCLBF|nr:putative Elongation factor 1-beta [Sclerotinia borealis F-4128]